MPTLKDRPTDAKPRQDAGTSVEADNPLALTRKRLDAAHRLRFDPARKAFVIEKDADPDLINWALNG
jgi:hypothetical protein